MLNVYIAIGPYCYGFGITEHQAIDAAKENWNSYYTKIDDPQDEHFSVWKTPSLDVSVDGMGNVHSASKLEKIQTSSLAE